MPGLLKNFMTALLARLDNPPAPILTHLRSLRDMPPELARINMARFEASITAAGVVTQPDVVRLDPNFDAEIFAMVLYEQDPANDHDDAPFVTFNTEEDGRGRSIFKSDWSMGMVKTDGVSEVFMFPRGLYRVQKGATLKTTFVAASDYSVANTKRWGVTYLLNEWRRQ